jgi:photosystem II stability/assembly factor-like uncharacterized protein
MRLLRPLLPVLLVVAPAAAGAQEEPPSTRRPARAAAQAESPDTIGVTLAQGMKARSIGPAIMGGRVSDIAIDPAAPYTWYVALATGGVLKTTDNGGSFQGVFDGQPVASTGAVAVSPADPKVVWVGSGEANDRNSSGWGDGVYRSADGGATWANVGLRTSRTIARIAVHPTDANVAYVAAMGDLWGPGGERGCYRTADGGKTWTRVLAAPAPFTDRVGCGDIAVDPVNPNTVYATLYARRRRPWAFDYGVAVTDGKDVGGIYKSTDGGATWNRLTSGLPTLTGRIGLSVYAKDPKIVYAIVQSDEGGTSNIDQVLQKKGGVFRSEDGGATWTRTSALNPRPFYFSQVRVNPTNDKEVWVLGYAVHVSEDGGKTFREDRFKGVHPDNHALAFDPAQPKRVLLGTDGGMYQSYDAGTKWSHAATFAGGQFYRINVDMKVPYRICGGLQDNLNWVGPSRTYTKDGIANTDWINIGGGDGFWCVFDPDSSDMVFAESQQGYIHRMHLATGEIRQLRPEPTEGQPGYRFHWNSPLVGSRHHRGAMYLAGNRVFKLTEHGESWKPISPDLSTKNVERILATGSGAETYGVVYALAESPLKAGMLWAGTDDGKLWVTEDEGATWRDLTASLPAEVRGEWIQQVEASSADASVAYVVVEGHRSQKLAPYVLRTEDMGRTWRNVAANLPKEWPAKVVREHPRNPSLLFAGTESGLWASTDRGRSWRAFGGLPTVPVDDIVIHPRDNDLVVATHGRSLFVVDDVGPLERLTREVRAAALHLFPMRDAVGRFNMEGWAEWSGSTGHFRGENPPLGATIDFYVRDVPAAPVKVAITNASGQPVANLTSNAMRGINRLVWDLLPTNDVLLPYGSTGRKFVPSGEYTVTVTAGSEKATGKIKVAIMSGIETR